MTAPLVSPEVDLRDFAFMPMDAVTLRDSDLATMATGDEFRAAVLLWCACWHQVPAASLPNDDRLLAKLAGYGRGVDDWLVGMIFSPPLHVNPVLLLGIIYMTPFSTVHRKVAPI